MAKFRLTMKGNKAVLKGLEKIRKETAKKIGEEIEQTAWNIDKRATSNAPVNDGFLKGSISVQTKGLTSRVEVGVQYAPFIEFGTGSKVQVPAGLQEYADSFRGRKLKGGWKEFEQNIKEWMRKKGIEEEALYPIMASIYREGIHPQPFLFPAFEAERPKLIENIKKVLNEPK